MHINFYFRFQCVRRESVVFTTLNLLAKNLTKVKLLARFFLQRMMFITFISKLSERLKSGIQAVKFQTLVRFLANKFNVVKPHFHVEHIEIT